MNKYPTASYIYHDLMQITQFPMHLFPTPIIQNNRKNFYSIALHGFGGIVVTILSVV